MSSRVNGRVISMKVMVQGKAGSEITERGCVHDEKYRVPRTEPSENYWRR